MVMMQIRAQLRQTDHISCMCDRRRSTWARLVSVLGAVVFTTTAMTVVARAEPGPVLGIAVSSDQHAAGAAIQWDRVAAVGARVAVVEATDGGHYRNPWFTADFSAARTAGLVRGSYSVGRPATPLVASATQQANYYLARLGNSATAKQTLPPMLDLQTTGNLSQAQLVTWTQTFLLRLHDVSGRVPILHTYSYLWATALGSPDAFARYPLWTSSGVSAFPGVSTPVQTLAVNTDDASWAAWQSGGATAPWADSSPGAPTLVHARAYDGSATVGWVPGDTGSSAVTGYQLLAEPGDIATTVGGDATQANVTGLTDGTAYTFAVTATNAVGAGAPSVVSAAVTPGPTLGAVPPVSTAPAQHPLYTSNCMAPSNLVHNTVWRRTHPATGVTLAEGHHRDSRGRVQMHILFVDLKNPHVRLAPLMRHVSDHHKLSVLARQRNLVAATNAGYFDLSSGAPTSPVVVDSKPVFGPGITSTVVGLGPDGLMTTTGVAASGSVTGPRDVLPLAGWNASQPGEGINAYSARWGARAVPMPRDAVSRRVAYGVVTTAVGRSAIAPPTGYLLVARGAVAAGWLRSLQAGDHVAVHIALTSTSRSSVPLAFGVGNHIVSNGVAGTGFRCNRKEHLPARTALGWTADRRHLIVLAVENNPRAKLHGLEPNQLGRVMRDLGAADAYMFDGGGSTEMVVRPHVGARLSVRNHPSDGVERKIPLGFGIFRR
jgi:GH25 family lysozyme M1 (1,4-beta-N-acetylmuramidase)